MNLSFITELARIAADSNLASARESLRSLLSSGRDPQLGLFLEEILRCSGPEFVLERDDVEVAVLNLGLGRQRVEAIHPAHYCLRLSTGRVLWAEELTEANVILRPETADLRLAAAIEALQTTPSREAHLADGHLVLRVFPRPNAGVITLEEYGRIS